VIDVRDDAEVADMSLVHRADYECTARQHR
jgi:hypothetical protein